MYWYVWVSIDPMEDYGKALAVLHKTMAKRSYDSGQSVSSVNVIVNGGFSLRRKQMLQNSLCLAVPMFFGNELYISQGTE